MVFSLSMNRMASMPEMLKPMGRPSLLAKNLIFQGEIHVL